MQSENPCFGTCTELVITDENLFNLGFCLIPVSDHKPFPAPDHLSLNKSYSVHVLGGGASRLWAF